MNNLCIIAHGRSSCENFISCIDLPRVKFNSFDFLYKQETVINFPPTRHLIKIYAETISCETVMSLLKKIEGYQFLYFYRSNILKQFITKKLQDNLVGEYGKDYNKFYLDQTEFSEYVKKYETVNSSVTRMNISKNDILEYDADLNKFTITDELKKLNCFNSDRFDDAFNLEVAKKFICNFDSIKYLFDDG